MKLVVISSALFIKEESQYFAYSPYIKEIEIWSKNVDEVAFCCPVSEKDSRLLISPVPFEIAKLFNTKEFNIKSLKNLLGAITSSVWNFRQLFKAMRWADHIHLRCPGNIGLMGCIVQIFFPGKKKTAKYAGNWDPNSKQPWSYKLQQWILRNMFLTKNMQVLVYGEWKESSKNIKPFFTASYRELDKHPVQSRLLLPTLSFMYVGMLSSGKHPLYAIQIVEALNKRGNSVTLSLYGNGTELENLAEYIIRRNLGAFVFLKGNQPQELIKKAYQDAHFVILPSESEGWPKVVAEGMFWGCLPIATMVSCVPSMLDFGNRGILITMDLEQDLKLISELITDPVEYEAKVSKGIQWSRKYTLELFENEIKELLKA